MFVNRNEEVDDSVIIVGKLCEFGDIIIKDVKLFLLVKCGDYFVILLIGVYYYFMVFNYN